MKHWTSAVLVLIGSKYHDFETHSFLQLLDPSHYIGFNFKAVSHQHKYPSRKHHGNSSRVTLGTSRNQMHDYVRRSLTTKIIDVNQ